MRATRPRQEAFQPASASPPAMNGRDGALLRPFKGETVQKRGQGRRLTTTHIQLCPPIR
jgi:hypothetical protein